MQVEAIVRDVRFSVIVPSRNRPDMVSRAVASVIAQTCSDFELIVLDDASEPPLDATTIAKGDARVRLIRSPANLGAAGARNLGIQNARGQLVSFLDDDDEFLPQFLELTWQSFMDRPDAGFSWCSVTFAGRGDLSLKPRIFERRAPNSLATIQDALTIGTGFGLTVRAEAIDGVGLFDPMLRVTEDIDYVIRLLKADFQPVVVEPVLVRIHDHTGVRMTSKSNNEVRAAEIRKLVGYHAAFFDEHPGLDSVLLRHAKILSGTLHDGAMIYELDFSDENVAQLIVEAGAARSKIGPMGSKD